MSGFRLNTPPGAIRRALGDYLTRVSNRQEKKKILIAGAIEVKREAQTDPTPRWEKGTHYYYPVDKRRRRIPITPGNLRKSMRAYFTREEEAEVGPQFLHVAPPEMGKTRKTASGYYAQMIYGSASAFRKQIMEPALNNARNRAFAAIVKKYAEVHKKAVK